MALEKFTWENGSQVEPAKVEIEGISHNVVDAQYEGSTPLSASNLNLMQDTLLANVKDNLDDESKIASCKAVKEVYSTDEVKTNKTWINNKPIYRKVIANEVDMTNGSEISLSSISNMDNLVSIQSKEVKASDNFVFYNNYYDSSTNKFNLFHYISRNSLYLYAGSSIHYTTTVIIEYTKTTD